MATPQSSEGTTQTDGEGPDTSDKPPHADISRNLQKLNISSSSSQTVTPGKMNGAIPIAKSQSGSYPLPPPDSLTLGDKQPGFTRGSLQKLVAVPLSTSNSCSSSSSQNHQHKKHASAPQSPNLPSALPSPTETSPTDSYWDGPSAPPSRGPSRPSSQPPSRAPSMSAGVSGGKITGLPTPAPVAMARERRGSQPQAPVPVTPVRRKSSSAHSDKGETPGKFNLKDLLASAPKLNRKSSQRSTSSRRSDSDAGEGNGRPRSTAGDSTASLTQKYGVCQKVAIGKGATSVVRLAHKWDRSEEKLYAIKVG